MKQFFSTYYLPIFLLLLAVTFTFDNHQIRWFWAEQQIVAYSLIFFAVFTAFAQTISKYWQTDKD